MKFNFAGSLLAPFLFLLFASHALAQSCPATLSTCPSPSYNAITAASGTVNGSPILSSVTGATAGANSNITSLTGLTTPLADTMGGTGVANSIGTLSWGGSVAFSGAYTTTVILLGNTSITLPTSGTMLTTTGNGAGLSGLTYSQLPALTGNQLIGSLTAVTPSAQSVPSCSTSTSALIWTSGTGFGCNILANTATFAAPPALGSTTPAAATITTLTGGGTASTVAAGAGAGTSPTVTVSGHSLTGLLSLTTGTSPTTSAILATITLGTAFSAAPTCTFAPANQNAASLTGTSSIYVTSTTSTLVFNAGSTALTASTAYAWNYQCEK